MGFIIRFIKSVLRWTLYFIAFVALIVLIPNLPPYTTFTSYQVDPVQARFDTLDHCVSLNGAKRLVEGKLHGPEAFAIVNGELLTTLGTGEVVKVSPTGAINIVTKIGEPCSGVWEEEKCGRPLGVKHDPKTNTLYILDAYYGIWRMDMKSNKKHLLVSPRVEVEGHRPVLINSMDLDVNGDIYYSESSLEFPLKDGFYITLADPSGRLVHYNAAKNQSTVLLDKLACANGVVISPNREFVLVAETFKMSVTKYYISGPKKGHSEVFVTGLPGYPDNIQPLPDGSGFLLAQYAIFDKDHPVLSKNLAQTPILRKFAARVLRMVEIPFEFLNEYFPNIVFQKITYNIGNFRMSAATLPPMAGLLKIDWNGNIVQCYVNSDTSVAQISDAVVFNNLLYMGSPHSNYIGTAPAPEDLIRAFKSTVPVKPAPEKIVKEIPADAPPTPKKAEEKKPAESVPPAQTAKPAEQKPASAKPVEQKPAAAKPAEQKPAAAKPVDPKPAAAKPADSKPAPAKPAEQKPVPAKPAEEKAAKPAEQKPAPAKPVDQKPAAAKPAEQKPAAAKPIEQKPAAAKPAEQKPAEQKPAAAKPAEQKPAAAKPAEQKPAAAKPAEQKPAAAKPAEQKPAAAKPAEQKPAAPKAETKPPVKEEIPIKEDIPVDTKKPSEEKLKVITKTGPAEIPNPNKV